MQHVAQRALQPAAIHAVILLQVPNRRLDGLPPAQPTFLLRVHALDLAPVDDLFVRVVGIHAAKSQVNHNLLECGTHILRQLRRLLRGRVQGVAVVGLARLAFAYALHLRRGVSALCPSWQKLV